MNAVLGFFSKLSRQRLNDAIINSHDRCFTAIEDYIEHHNANDARPFRWSKKSEDFGEAWKKGIGSSKKGYRQFECLTKKSFIPPDRRLETDLGL